MRLDLPMGESQNPIGFITPAAALYYFPIFFNLVFCFRQVCSRSLNDFGETYFATTLTEEKCSSH